MNKIKILLLLVSFSLIFFACANQQSKDFEVEPTVTITPEKTDQPTPASEKEMPAVSISQKDRLKENYTDFLNSLPNVSKDYTFSGAYDIDSNGTMFLLTGVMDDDMPHYLIDWNLIQPDNLKAKKDFFIKASSIFDFNFEPYDDTHTSSLKPYISDFVLSKNMMRYIVATHTKKKYIDSIVLYDTKSKSSINAVKNNDFWIFDYDSKLTKCIVRKEIGNWDERSYEYYLMDLENNKLIDIGLKTENSFSSIMFSPDDSKIFLCLYNRYKSSEHEYYIYIYDLKSKVFIKKRVLNLDDHAYFHQWTTRDEILFNVHHKAYSYDLKTDQLLLLGEDMNNPIMSPNGRYIAYYTGEDDIYGGCLGDTGGYFGLDVSLKIKDLKENIVYEAPSIYSYEVPSVYSYLWRNSIMLQYPLQWIYSSDIGIQDDYYIDDYETKDYKEFPFIQSFMSLSGYPERNILDKDPTTCWAEGHIDSGCSYGQDGIGESINIKTYRVTNDKKFSYDVVKSLRGFKIINGYAKSKETYYNNNRVKQVEIELSNGNSFMYELKDNDLGFQTFYFPEPQVTTKFKLYIRDVFTGDKYHDTCISEIELIE